MIEGIRISRREALGWSAVAALATARVRPAAAQRDAAPLAPLNRFPRMVHQNFLRRMDAFARSPAEKAAGLNSREDAEAYVRRVRHAARACFGPFPERTPLNAKVTGVVERDDYRIDKVLFESRPGFLVSANVYVPSRRSGLLPGVVGSCGHSHNGKAEETYQAFAQGLAKLGFVCLIFDPIGQGERFQFPDQHGRSTVGAGVAEHLMVGNQQFLVGEFFGAWRAWDGVRALDYLLTREEVDPQRVGITGNSGGGTMTTWLCALEDRWTMAAPSCFVTTFRRNLENELPADTEQCPPGAIAADLDHCDFVAALAPKPVILIAQEHDYFDVRGTMEAFQFLRRLYGLLGAEENVALHVGPNDHGFHKDGREAMYRWFRKACGRPDDVGEPDIAIEKDEVLWATPGGQVAPLGSRSVFSFTAEKSRSLREVRESATFEDVVSALRDAVQGPADGREAPWDPVRGPEYRILRPLGNRRHPQPQTTVYAVRSSGRGDGPETFAVVYGVSPAGRGTRAASGGRDAVLYVAHHSSDAELRDEPIVRECIAAEPESPFFACDVRGIGESKPDTCSPNSFLQPYGSDYFYAAYALMLGAPYVAQKTWDVIAVLSWLRARGVEEVHLVARGWGALPATFAALLSKSELGCAEWTGDVVRRVTFKNALASYAAVAESETYDWPLSSFLPGVLSRFDLPECYRELERRTEFRNVDPWGAGRPAKVGPA
jgi:dienelactone hydrolase